MELALAISTTVSRGLQSPGVGKSLKHICIPHRQGSRQQCTGWRQGCLRMVSSSDDHSMTGGMSSVIEVRPRKPQSKEHDISTKLHTLYACLGEELVKVTYLVIPTMS